MPSMSAGMDYLSQYRFQNSMTTDTDISLILKDEVKDVKNDVSGSKSGSHTASDKLSLSEKAKSLYRKYTNKEYIIKSRYNSAKHRLEADYQRKKQELKAEYQREKQALGVNLYV